MFAMQVEAVKLFVLKTINLATLVYQLFVIQTNANSAQKYLHLSNYTDYLSVSLQTFLHTILMPDVTSRRTYFSRLGAGVRLCVRCPATHQAAWQGTWLSLM